MLKVTYTGYYVEKKNHVFFLIRILWCCHDIHPLPVPGGTLGLWSLEHVSHSLTASIAYRCLTLSQQRCGKNHLLCCFYWRKKKMIEKSDFHKSIWKHMYCLYRNEGYSLLEDHPTWLLLDDLLLHINRKALKCCHANLCQGWGQSIGFRFQVIISIEKLCANSVSIHT